METFRHSLNFDLSRHELPPLDKYAQQILENSKTFIPDKPTITAAAAATTTTTPTIQPLSIFAAVPHNNNSALNSTNDILQRIGATLINSIQLKKFIKIDNSPIVGGSLVGPSDTNSGMDLYGMQPPPNHIAIDSTGFEAMDELQRQLEYDKFMNEIWIGVVLTLILISMIFCLCSCFLYHQFRAWKRNYRTTITQSLNTLESETRKLYPDFDDPVPEYTLVSGLPSYEAALELLKKTPKSCLIVNPSVCNLFNVNEKSSNEKNSYEQQQQTKQKQQAAEAQLVVDVTAPLLPSIQTTQQAAETTTTTNVLLPGKAYAILPTYEEANCQQNSMLLHSANVTLTAVNEKKKSVEEAKEKKHTAGSMLRTNSMTETTAITAMEAANITAVTASVKATATTTPTISNNIKFDC